MPLYHSDMTTEGLANTARKLRKERGLTLQDVGERVLTRTGKATSRQAISKAEDPTVGTSMNNLRIKIIEELSGMRLLGPFWRFDT